jgi:sugar phosphate isomerase/epimerase
MEKINRRSFITKSSMILAALPLARSREFFASSTKYNYPTGFQTWVVKDMLNKDLKGTLKTMAGMGYKQLEMCYPKGYKESGFGPLAAMKTSEIKAAIDEAGLVCPSSHFGGGDFFDDASLNESIQYAHDLGLSQMILSTFWLPKTATLDDYKASADKLNKAAVKIKSEGMQAGFHNHEFEFHMLENQLIYDVLMNQFDPDLVKMQFQLEVINLGYKAVDYFKKYPGRFISAHLSDWTADKKAVPLGQGIVNWDEFFAATKTAGIKNCFVEMEFDTLKPSAAYLKKLS